MDSITQEETLIFYVFPERREEGRGIMQIEGAYIEEIMKLMEYVETNEDPQTEIVRTH
jgi:hypothetical protein